MVTLIGMFYGAKKNNQIKEIIRYSIKSSFFISIIYSLIFYFFSDNILSVFIKENESIRVIDIGVSYFKIFSFAVPFISIGMIGGRVMQGFGKAYPMFIITCLRVIIISCSLAWYFIEKLNKPIEFAWYAILISCIISSIVSIIWMLLELRNIQFE
jgi:Na+-driven multidrug efflux pump